MPNTKNEKNFEKIKDFKEVFDKGKKFKTSSSQIIVLVEESQQQNSSLSLGVLALKKIVGKKAVHRNKAKRRFRHGFLSRLQIASVEHGFHVKIIALTNKTTLCCPWSQILFDIEKEFQFINKEIANFKGKRHEEGLDKIKNLANPCG
jgi:ribonuclease P protein component